MPVDPFFGDEIQLEVWGRVAVVTAPVRMVASLLPEAVSVAGTAQRYTSEFGAAGKLLQPVGTVASLRTVRIGTLTAAVNRANPMRYRIRCEFSPATSTYPAVRFEEVYIVQPSRRMVGPSGRVNNESYPAFLQSTAARKVIKSDLSGESGTYEQTGNFPDHGLGGEPMELDPGASNWVFVKTSDGVPDDPNFTNVPEIGTAQVGMVFDVTPRWHLARD
jgi:hypothetical protein